MKEISLSQAKTAKISDEDYPQIKNLKWAASRIGPKWYVTKSYYLAGKKSTISLHRFLTGAGPDERVVFKNGDTLDCRRENLVKVRKFALLVAEQCPTRNMDMTSRIARKPRKSKVDPLGTQDGKE